MGMKLVVGNVDDGIATIRYGGRVAFKCGEGVGYGIWNGCMIRAISGGRQS